MKHKLTIEIEIPDDNIMNELILDNSIQRCIRNCFRDQLHHIHNFCEFKITEYGRTNISSDSGYCIDNAGSKMVVGQTVTNNLSVIYK